MKLHLLVYRYSSLGDVALCLPVLRGLLDHNPELRITLATNKRFATLFHKIERLDIFGVDTSGEHRGPRGIFQLARRLLRCGQTDALVDLHDVTRSRLLSFFLKLLRPGLPIYRYHKGRGAKSRLTRRKHKVLSPLPHTTKRYLEAFVKTGLVLPEKLTRGVEAVKKTPRAPNAPLKVGIAPLSAHRLKEWPAVFMRELMVEFAKTRPVEYSLLGGPGEKERLDEYITGDFPCQNMAGAHPDFRTELEFISTLDLIITMDSANMHLGALLGVATLSIWGPTHPFAGFSPLQLEGQKPLLAQLDDLACRPCSVYGNKPCHRKDHACMNRLEVSYILSILKDFFAKRS